MQDARAAQATTSHPPQKVVSAHEGGEAQLSSTCRNYTRRLAARQYDASGFGQALDATIDRAKWQQSTRSKTQQAERKSNPSTQVS